MDGAMGVRTIADSRMVLLSVCKAEEDFVIYNAERKLL